MTIEAHNLKIDVDALVRIARKNQAYCLKCDRPYGTCRDCEYATLLRAVGHGIPPNKPYREVWQ